VQLRPLTHDWKSTRRRQRKESGFISRVRILAAESKRRFGGREVRDLKGRRKIKSSRRARCIGLRELRAGVEGLLGGIGWDFAYGEGQSPFSDRGTSKNARRESSRKDI